LKIGIEDYRKNAVSLIIVPYFVNVLRLSDEESYNRTRDWILKCHDTKRLELSTPFFESLIKYEINRARRKGIKPLKFKVTLKYRNRKLYELLLNLLRN
jgi:hypothetical protein